jgi:tRNA threonylcarbamoyladenosine biosynthesis protein TsaE
MATGMILTIELPDETATQALARSLAALANSGEQLALIGDLGTGKTVFARAFVRALCGADIEVPSPTFTIVQTYDAKDGRELFHFDLYRLESPDEALELDIDDAFANGISLIEWPERLGSFLPPNHLKLTLSYSDTESQRLAIITAGNNWTERLREISL